MYFTLCCLEKSTAAGSGLVKARLVAVALSPYRFQVGLIFLQVAAMLDAVVDPVHDLRRVVFL